MIRIRDLKYSYSFVLIMLALLVGSAAFLLFSRSVKKGEAYRIDKSQFERIKRSPLSNGRDWDLLIEIFSPEDTKMVKRLAVGTCFDTARIAGKSWSKPALEQVAYAAEIDKYYESADKKNIPVLCAVAAVNMRETGLPDADIAGFERTILKKVFVD